jgi:hypothetical protein
MKWYIWAKSTPTTTQIEQSKTLQLTPQRVHARRIEARFISPAIAKKKHRERENKVLTRRRISNEIRTARTILSGRDLHLAPR